MMQKNSYTDKVNHLKGLKKGASPETQLEIDFTLFGMQWAFGESEDEPLHNERMSLLFSDNPNDKRKGELYRKGMDIVLYSVRGKKREKGTVILPALRVNHEIEHGLHKIKRFLGVKTLAPVRKLALQWYIEMMNEQYGKEFNNDR